MIKMDINDFIFEVKEEILSYEDLGEKKAEEWENKFRKWLNDNSIKKKNIKKTKNGIVYLIRDESEIFDIADKYFDAVELGKENNYWEKFQ